MLLLNPNEHLEPLGGGLRIVVSPAYTFSTDSILLAHFAAVQKRDTACDLGTGCGIIPLLWCKNETGAITAVDLQKEACALLQKSLALNDLENRIAVVCADLRQPHNLLPAGAFDLVSMNPPFFAAGTGKQSREESGALARHETACTLEEAAAAAARLLRFGGRFCLCHKPERLADVFCALRANKLEPKRLRFAAQRPGKTPWLALIEGRRGAKPGLRLEPTLVLQNEDGGDSDEMREYYADYRNC